MRGWVPGLGWVIASLRMRQEFHSAGREMNGGPAPPDGLVVTLAAVVLMPRRCASGACWPIGSGVWRLPEARRHVLVSTGRGDASMAGRRHLVTSLSAVGGLLVAIEEMIVVVGHGLTFLHGCRRGRVSTGRPRGAVQLLL